MQYIYIDLLTTPTSLTKLFLTFFPTKNLTFAKEKNGGKVSNKKPKNPSHPKSDKLLFIEFQ